MVGSPCRLLEGTSGVGPIERFDASAFQTTFAAQIKNFSSEGYAPQCNTGRAPLASRGQITHWRHVQERRSIAGLLLVLLDHLNFLPPLLTLFNEKIHL